MSAELGVPAELLCIPEALCVSPGPEDWHVLPEDKASCQPHPVHPQQGEAAGAGEVAGGGGEGEEQGSHGVLPGEQGGVPHVWLLRAGPGLQQSHSTCLELLCWDRSICNNVRAGAGRGVV